MYRLFGIFAILTLLCISSTSGHDINYQFTSISVAEGLSQSTAQSILLDKKGKLWIGTKNGLNSYTGQNLKIFKSHPNDRYSLPSNHIIHLTQDSLNDIWISTRQGMVRYDETHGNFIPFNHDIIYSSLCINGGVLFGSENRIYKYDYQKRSFKAVCINPKGATASFPDQMIFVIDHIIEALRADTLMLRFLERSFVWPGLDQIEASGEAEPLMRKVLQTVMCSPEMAGRTEREIYQRITALGSMCISVCYTSVLEGKPDNIDNMKPILYDIIRRAL